jgi:hypothetical protein
MPTFDDVRSMAMALPEVEEILTWDVDITFRVRKKIFVIGGEGGQQISLKASLDQQADLLDLDPETFKSAPYVGRFGWVTVDLARVDPAMLEGLLRQGWRSVAPKALLKAAGE